tara:strand:+ start:2470 stop:3027 length:558 start_codon:yes stop_codon:yes gene_type:complete
MIDFTKYDTSYELQSMQLMINILQPYITFKKEEGNDIQIHIVTEDKVEKPITMKEYIHFIQIIFPKMIQGDIDSLYDQKQKDTIMKEIFESRRSNGEFRLPLFLGTTDDSVYERYIQEFNQMGVEELEEFKKAYKKGLLDSPYNEKMKEIDEKSVYLENVRILNRRMNGTIQDVIQFIRNLEYYL